MNSVMTIQKWRSFPALTLEQRQYLTSPQNPDCPLSRVVGNEAALEKIRLAAIIGLDRQDHCISDLRPLGLIGPSGVGKSKLAETLGAILEIPVVEIDCPRISELGDFHAEIVKAINRVVAKEFQLVEHQLRGHFLYPPCIVLLDECHGLPPGIEADLVPALDPKTRQFVTQGGRTVDCRNVYWMFATTDCGKLQDAFDSKRFDHTELRCYTDKEIARIVQLNDPDWSSAEACHNVARHQGKIPRAAIEFADKVKQHWKHFGNPPDVWKRTAEKNGIEPLPAKDDGTFRSMTEKQRKVLELVAEHGPITLKRLHDFVGGKIEDLRKYTIPYLLEATQDQPAYISVGKGGGYWLTGAGVKALVQRELRFNDKALAPAARREFAEQHNSAGLAHYAKGEYKAAVMSHTEAIRWSPETASYLVNRGDAYCEKGSEQGRYTEAIRDYKEALRLNPPVTAEVHPKLVAALNRRAAVYDQERKDDLATADREKAIQLGEEALQAGCCLGQLQVDLSELYYKRGEYYQMARRLPEAIESYRRSYSLSKEDCIFQAIGDCFAELEDRDAPQREAYGITQSAHVWLCVGYAEECSRQKNYDEAIRVCDLAGNMHQPWSVGDAVDLLQARGEAYLAKGQIREAASDFVCADIDDGGDGTDPVIIAWQEGKFCLAVEMLKLIRERGSSEDDKDIDNWADKVLSCESYDEDGSPPLCNMLMFPHRHEKLLLTCLGERRNSPDWQAALEQVLTARAAWEGIGCVKRTLALSRVLSLTALQDMLKDPKKNEDVLAHLPSLNDRFHCKHADHWAALETALKASPPEHRLFYVLIRNSIRKRWEAEDTAATGRSDPKKPTGK